MPKSLVIVESPAKARTISKFLGSDYVVEASYGHVRDLPQGAEDVPEEYKHEPWANDGVDPDNDFKALYVIPRNKADQIKKLEAAGMLVTRPDLGPFRAKMDPAYKRIAAYAGEDNVKKFRDMVDQARKA